MLAVMKNIIGLVIILLVAVLVYLLVFKQSEPNTDANSVSGTLPKASIESAPQARDLSLDLTSKSPENAAVFIISPGDGSVVSSPVDVEFGITGMDVVPAGQQQENAGHHHLLINMGSFPPLDLPLPATDQLIHFGGGQTSTTIELEPGEHTLQLLLGNHLHVPHDPPVFSKKITITVE